MNILIGCDVSGPIGNLEDISEPTDVYQLVFSDEFNTTSLDTSKWNYETGYGDNGWGNDEWQLYTNNDENVKIENGILIISAICPSGNIGKRDGSITSGRINSLDKASFRYGKIQARIKIPYQNGIWSAFWLMGSNFAKVGWPQCGEIDVMKTFAKYLSDNENEGVLHWWNEDANKKTDSIDYYMFDSPLPNVGQFSESLADDYHIYEVEWNKEKIIWRVDGIDFYREYITDSNKSEFHNDFFIIFNVAVGGNLGGDVDEDTFKKNNVYTPRSLYIDWIRVYQKEIMTNDTKIMGGSIYSESFISDIFYYKNNRIVNSVDWGGDFATPNTQCTDVSPKDGDYVLSVDFMSIDKGWSLIAFEFDDEDLSLYSTLVFSIDSSAFSALKDLGIKVEDNNKQASEVQLLAYSPVISDNWSTYEIPLSNFSRPDLTKFKFLMFSNPMDIDSNPVYGTLYFDMIYLKKRNTEELTKSALLNAIAAANTLRTTTEIGDAVGQVSFEDSNAYAEAVSIAQSVVDNAMATESELNAALADLAEATKAFEAAIIQDT